MRQVFEQDNCIKTDQHYNVKEKSWKEKGNEKKN